LVREDDAMARRGLARRIVSGGLACVLSLGISQAVAGQEYVTVTNVTIDKVAYLCGETTESGCVRLTGTLTCETTGLAQLIDLFIQQRDLSGVDDLDLLDFACSTEPRSFNVAVESGGCDPGVPPPNGCFRPGRATVQAVVFRGLVLAEQSVRIRKS
jgi:hypothetical protein